MSFNPANYLILSSGSFSIKNIMLAAHAKARAGAQHRVILASHGVKRTYAQDFQEAIQWAWDRARQMQRMAVAA